MPFSTIVGEDAESLITMNPDLFDAICGKKVLITGGSGFICSYIVETFAIFNDLHRRTPIQVVAIDNFQTASSDRLAHSKSAHNVELVKQSVLDRFDFGDVRFDYLIHGASIASPTYYRHFPLETINVNVNGTWRMLDLAKKYKSSAMLFFSSSEIYGNPDPAFIPTEEDYVGLVSCTGPRACYDESKRLAETICVNYHRQYDLPVKIVRPFNVYGPRQRLNDKRIVPDLLSDALRGGPLVLLSDGSPTRSFCYIKDFVRASLMILVKGNAADPYNVGNDEEVTILEAARTMAEIAAIDGAPLEVQFQVSQDAEYLTDNPKRRCPDLTKVRTQFNYEPEFNLRTGFERTYRSYTEEYRV